MLDHAIWAGLFEEINGAVWTPDRSKIDRPDRPSGTVRPAAVQGSAIPKAGKRFGGTAPAV